MSRAQKIYRDISFDSEIHDVYNPKFSSEDGDESDEFADEEAKAKVCDERLSELNPCNESPFSSDKTQLERCAAHDSENLKEDDI
jgi:hypothetical protein